MKKSNNPYPLISLMGLADILGNMNIIKLSQVENALEAFMKNEANMVRVSMHKEDRIPSLDMTRAIPIVSDIVDKNPPAEPDEV